MEVLLFFASLIIYFIIFSLAVFTFGVILLVISFTIAIIQFFTIKIKNIFWRENKNERKIKR